MTDGEELGKELFTQDGVLIKSVFGKNVVDSNATGTLCITEYPNGSKCLEWKPIDLITVDSESQDQEWAVVNTIGRRTRTFSGNPTGSESSKSKTVSLPFNDLKSFSVSRNGHQITFTDKTGIVHITFFFQHANADVFVSRLKVHLKTVKSRKDKNTYYIAEPSDEVAVLNRSFAELDIFTENTTDVVWNLVNNFKQRPYATTLEAFSKLTDIVYYGTDNGKRYTDDDVADLLSRSMSMTDETTTTAASDEYEVVTQVPTLPPRPNIPRGTPLSPEQWGGLQDSEGRIEEVDGVKQIIFRGGVSPSIRHDVWKFLLDYFPWHMSRIERAQLQKRKIEEYFTIKLQWKSMTEGQENRFTEFKERKSLVEKDVNRTDRTNPFYAGDDNPNLTLLLDILVTYVMYNFDLGYVQGMSDLLSPILCLLGNEVDAFWCFVGFMDKVASNFDMDQAGMKLQLQRLHTLLTFTNPDLANYLSQHDSGNMFFCFRWLLVWFKRELSPSDIMGLWEVLWTGLPCANFHLLICVAILDTEKDVLMSNGYGFNEILKHVNDLSMHIKLQCMLSKAEGIYHQISASSHLNDTIRIILGMETVGQLDTDNSDTENPGSSSSNDMDRAAASGDNVPEQTCKNVTAVSFSPDREEVAYQQSIDLSFL